MNQLEPNILLHNPNILFKHHMLNRRLSPIFHKTHMSSHLVHSNILLDTKHILIQQHRSTHILETSLDKFAMFHHWGLKSYHLIMAMCKPRILLVLVKVQRHIRYLLRKSYLFLLLIHKFYNQGSNLRKSYITIHH